MTNARTLQIPTPYDLQWVHQKAILSELLVSLADNPWNLVALEKYRFRYNNACAGGDINFCHKRWIYNNLAEVFPIPVWCMMYNVGKREKENKRASGPYHVGWYSHGPTVMELVWYIVHNFLAPAWPGLSLTHIEIDCSCTAQTLISTCIRPELWNLCFGIIWVSF